jgi:GrpB-like predicted nucleotidyltransferase (UPF0157 family)
VSARSIVIVDYDPEWPGRASALIAELASALGDAALRIDHIGSTAIPLMAAKDILDIQVSVDDLDAAFESFDPGLRALGFEREAHARDHMPAGRLDDPELWVKCFWSRRGTADGDVNLHLRRVGSPNERLALLFRDWFRAHPAAVPSYAAFKRALAEALNDSVVYSGVKDPVVDLVIATAQTWAVETEWSP